MIIYPPVEIADDPEFCGECKRLYHNGFCTAFLNRDHRFTLLDCNRCAMTGLVVEVIKCQQCKDCYEEGKYLAKAIKDAPAYAKLAGEVTNNFYTDNHDKIFKEKE